MTQRSPPGRDPAVGILLFSIGLALIVTILAPSSTGPFSFFFGLIGGILIATGLTMIFQRTRG